LSNAGDGRSDVRIVGNRVRGAPYDTGIFVDASRGTFIAANDLSGVESTQQRRASDGDDK
jgi:hypothetical protein